MHLSARDKLNYSASAYRDSEKATTRREVWIYLFYILHMFPYLPLPHTSLLHITLSFCSFTSYFLISLCLTLHYCISLFPSFHLHLIFLSPFTSHFIPSSYSFLLSLCILFPYLHFPHNSFLHRTLPFFSFASNYFLDFPCFPFSTSSLTSAVLPIVFHTFIIYSHLFFTAIFLSFIPFDK